MVSCAIKKDDGAGDGDLSVIGTKAIVGEMEMDEFTQGQLLHRPQQAQSLVPSKMWAESEWRDMNLLEIRENLQLCYYCKTPGADQREPLRGSLLFAAICWLLLEQFPQEKKNSTQQLRSTYCIQGSMPGNL